MAIAPQHRSDHSEQSEPSAHSGHAEESPSAGRAAGLVSAAPQRLTGWGRSLAASSYVTRPSTREGIEGAFADARARGQTIALRGAGQSYGDAALNSGGLVLDLSRMRRILDWDPSSGRISVEPGVTINDVWRYAIEDGWWPPVVPGTSFASLGGAAAMNVHGKNNWKVGPIGNHIEELELLLPSGETRVLRRDCDGELFHGVIGGFGMLGVITRVTLALKKIHSGLLDVVPLAVRNLDEMCDRFEERMDRADYLVGWVDCFARGAATGRGLVHQARYLEPGADPEARATLRVSHQDLPDTLLGMFPKSRLWWIMRLLFNHPGIRATNAVKYCLGRYENGRSYRQPHAQFAFLLDFIPGWGLAYGRGGMIQYQSIVPAPQARRIHPELIGLAQRRGLTPLLGVFKRHRPDPFLISHGVDGYSLAIEFKVTAQNRARLWALAAEFDRIVVDGGGRFYFAKDATLTPASWAPFLAEERVQRFLALKRTHDPEGILQTDLYRRIFAGA